MSVVQLLIEIKCSLSKASSISSKGQLKHSWSFPRHNLSVISAINSRTRPHIVSKLISAKLNAHRERKGWGGWPNLNHRTDWKKYAMHKWNRWMDICVRLMFWHNAQIFLSGESAKWMPNAVLRPLPLPLKNWTWDRIGGNDRTKCEASKNGIRKRYTHAQPFFLCWPDDDCAVAAAWSLHLLEAHQNSLLAITKWCLSPIGQSIIHLITILFIIPCRR